MWQATFIYIWSLTPVISDGTFYPVSYMGIAMLLRQVMADRWYRPAVSNPACHISPHFFTGPLNHSPPNLPSYSTTTRQSSNLAPTPLTPFLFGPSAGR